MHCLNLAVLALMCNFLTVMAANYGNIIRNINHNVRGTFGGSLMARQDYEAFIAQEFSLPARGLPIESIVTVTVTATPEYCTAPTAPVPAGPETSPEVQTTPIPAGSATPGPKAPVTPVPGAPITPVPTGGLNPYPGAGPSSASPVPPVSVLPTPVVGANTTVTTSSLSATKSVVSSVLSVTSATTPSSAPATSSTAAPNGDVAKDSHMNGLLLTIALALSVNAVLLS